jgi:hypothetical protein
MAVVSSGGAVVLGVGVDVELGAVVVVEPAVTSSSSVAAAHHNTPPIRAMTATSAMSTRRRLVVRSSGGSVVGGSSVLMTHLDSGAVGASTSIVRRDRRQRQGPSSGLHRRVPHRALEWPIDPGGATTSGAIVAG